MEQEMEGQRSKGTFHEGESLPQGRSPVKARFIFKIKRTINGDIERFKVRLVAWGFSQQEGVDYFSTFSRVVGFDVIRVVLATAANKIWDINSLDFTQAYLNAPLIEDAWLQLPNGSITKAARVIYGLKQSAMEISSPSNPGMDLTPRRTDEEELDQNYKPYRTILRNIMFLAGMTRLDLSNSVPNWEDMQHLHAVDTGKGCNMLYDT
ncbi:unnamed protein product [Choristocarpus tenellus]